MGKKVAAKKKPTLTRRDPVESLTSEEAIAAYLEAAMEEAGDDPAYIAAVLGDIAKARGILKLAEDTGMTRGGMYRAQPGRQSFVRNDSQSNKGAWAEGDDQQSGLSMSLVRRS